MNYRQAMTRAKKAAKSQPGQSYYVVDDFDGIDVLTEGDFRFENEWSQTYGNRLMAIVSWWTAEPGNPAHYEIENYSQAVFWRVEMERAEFIPHTRKLYSNCLVVSYQDRRGVYCHVFIHEGDHIDNVAGNHYTVTGITDKGITIKSTGWNLGEVGERDLIYYFLNGFWNMVTEAE